MYTIQAVSLIIVFSNSCYVIAARLFHSDVNALRRFAAAGSQQNDEKWQSDVLRLHDRVLLANERTVNESHDQLLANERPVSKSYDQLLVNERRQWLKSKSLAVEESGSTRRRSKRKILRFESVPWNKWTFPIKYKIHPTFSGESAVRNCFCLIIVASPYYTTLQLLCSVQANLCAFGRSGVAQSM